MLPAKLSDKPLKFTNLVNHLMTAIVLLDDQKRLISLNQAAESLFRVSQKKVQGQPLSALMNVGEKLAEQLERNTKELYSVTNRGIEVTQTDSESLTIDLTVTPLGERHNGKILLEIQSLDRLKKLAKEELMTSRYESSANLVRNLAHEIKNPLGGIRGAAQLLHKELNCNNGTDELTEYTKIIMSEADRLRDLVDRLLGPRQATHKKNGNIHKILNKVTSLLANEAKQKIQIQCDYDPSLPELMLDGAQLTQVFLNIGCNALQAMLENHTKRPILTIKSRVEHRFSIRQKTHRLVCHICFCDNGPGIKPELRDKLFLPMSSGRTQGNGLGLSIAQALVMQHQGLIEYTSRPGCTCFNIYLPMEPTK